MPLFSAADIQNNQVTGSHHDLSIAALSQDKDPNKFERSEHEAHKLERVIKTLFGLSSRKFGFQLLPHPENWACGFSPDKSLRIQEQLQNGSLDLDNMTDDQFSPDAFYYPLSELRKLPEQEIYGVTHHESAHAQYTSFRRLLSGHKIAESEGKLSTTWGLLLNGVEDGRINRMKSAESDTIREQIAALYKSWQVSVTENIASQSLIRQYALSAVHYWLKGIPIAGMDTRVQATFDQTKDAVSRYINENGKEESYRILRDEIWPKVKHLEDEAKKDRELQQHKDNKKNLWDKLKDKMSGKGQNNSQPGQNLSPEEREQLEKEFNGLPENKKQELRDKAKQDLDKKQAQEASEDGIKGFSYDFDEQSGEHKLRHRPEMTDEDKKQGQKIIEDAIKAENEREAEVLRREKKNLEMNRNGFDEDQEELFDSFTAVRNSIVGLKTKFIKNLQGILPREVLKDFGGEFESGPRIDINRLVKRAPVRDARFYQRRTQEKIGDPLLNVELIVDNSISMDGIKIHEARRAVLLTLEVLSDLGLPSAVKRFANRFDWIQERRHQYQDRAAKVKPQILSKLNADGSGTNISDPLEETKQAITSCKIRHPKTVCLVVVITDGDANVGKTGKELKTLIADIQRQAIVVCINLSGNPSEVANSKRYFGERNVVVCNTVSDLPDELVKVLKNAFEQAIRKMN